jgi:hypothetical protein
LNGWRTNIPASDPAGIVTLIITATALDSSGDRDHLSVTIDGHTVTGVEGPDA